MTDTELLNFLERKVAVKADCLKHYKTVSNKNGFMNIQIKATEKELRIYQLAVLGLKAEMGIIQCQL